jgi:HAD superfamily phosphoserine phosphatase-like hydrolase
VENHLIKLIVFDLDHTLIISNSSYCFLKILYRTKVISFSRLLKGIFIRFWFHLTSMTVEELHHLAFNTLLKGLPLEALEKDVDILLDQLLPGSLYLPAFNELTAAQERGDYIALMSSSPDFLVKKFAAYFKIDIWEATVYDIDKENCLCKIAKLMVGTQKERCLLRLQKELGIPKSQVVVYTDSHDDIPLLMQAGEAVAVNPDKKLRKAAEVHHWRII